MSLLSDRLSVIGRILTRKAEFSTAKWGGGGILDIGCYTASMTRKMAGAADNKLFLNPVEIKGNGKVGPTGVDHIAAATLKFENGIIWRDNRRR